MPKMTAKWLREQAAVYFNGRREMRPLTEMVPVMEEQNGRMVPTLDAYGHQLKQQVTCRNAKGDVMLETVWYAAPTVAGLCLHLGINKTTFYRWLGYRPRCGEDKRDRERERLRDAAMEVEAVIEDYLRQQSMSKTASRGAIAQLERDYWRGGMGNGAEENGGQDETPILSMADIEAELRGMGILPQEGEGK